MARWRFWKQFSDFPNLFRFSYGKLLWNSDFFEQTYFNIDKVQNLLKHPVDGQQKSESDQLMDYG